MEQKKFDFTSFIGMILLGGIILWWMNSNQPEVTEDPNTPIEKVVDTTKTTDATIPTNLMQPAENDSIKNINSIRKQLPNS